MECQHSSKFLKIPFTVRAKNWGLPQDREELQGPKSSAYLFVCSFFFFDSTPLQNLPIQFQAVRAMLTSNHFFPLDLEVCLPWRRRTSQSTPSPSNCLAASKAIWTDLECATMVIWFPKAQWEREWENNYALNVPNTPCFISHAIALCSVICDVFI